MLPKEIGRQAGRIFESTLASNWAYRSQEDQEDYGIDGEIEIIDDKDKATGFIFKIQLKGTTVSTPQKNGSFVYNSASVERFEYYMDKVSIPTIFVVCDVNKEICYWTHIQGNQTIQNLLIEAKQKDQKTFTLTLEASDILKKEEICFNNIIRSIDTAKEAITIRAISTFSPNALPQFSSKERSKLEKRLRILATSAATEEIESLIVQKEFDAAITKAEKLFESEVESPECRIQAGYSLARAIAGSLLESNDPAYHRKIQQSNYRIAADIIPLARDKTCSNYTKSYAKCYLRNKRLSLNASQIMSLAMSEKMQSQQPDTLGIYFAQIQRIQFTQKISNDFTSIQKHIIKIVEDQNWHLIPYIWSDTAEGLNIFISAMRSLDKHDLADAYLDEMDRTFIFCIKVIESIFNKKEQEKLTIRVCMLNMRLGASLNDDLPSIRKRRKTIIQTIDSNNLSTYKESIIPILDRIVNETENPEPDTPPTLDELREHYIRLAYELGINLDDPKDRIAEIVRVGLQDLDPTRVSCNCEHIHLRYGPGGIPAQMLGLPSAGSKSIHCLKHGHSIQGFKLDDAYGGFSKSHPWGLTDGIHCEKCSDKKPHENGWKWSFAWEEKQGLRFDEQAADGGMS